MSLTNDNVTIAGNIGNDPTMGVTKAGNPVLNFRVGSSNGHWDRTTGAWVDGGTSWYAVSAFGALAENARASLHCGDPVIVTGRLKIKEWENDGRKGFSADITADAIGHDLNRGTAGFARRPKGGAPASTETRGQASMATEADAPQDGEAEYDEEVPAEHEDQWRIAGFETPHHGADSDADAESTAEPALA